MPTASISSQPIVSTQISSPAHENSNKKTKTPPPPPRVNSEMEVFEGMHLFFGAGKKISGQTHSERLLSAAKQKDHARLKQMILPGAEGTDSFRKLTTTAGRLIGVKFAEGKEVKAIRSSEAERNSKFVAPLMERYQAGKLDAEGKRQLMQGLAYQVYTSPVLETADGHTITFGDLGTTDTWDRITPDDLSRSDIDPKLDSALSDLRKVYEISASFPQNKPATSKPQYAVKEKGLRKLWQETKKGNFTSEVQRQAGKFNHKAASFFKAKPYVDSNLGEVFSVELRLLKTRDREQIEKKIIENQVLATIRQRTSPTGFINISPGGIAREVKKKSNYQHLAYQDKDIYLAEFIAKVRAAPEDVQQPASKAGDDRPTSKADEDRPASKADEKPLEDFSSGTSSQEVPNSRALSVQEVLDDKDLSLQDAMDGLWRSYQQNPETSRS